MVAVLDASKEEPEILIDGLLCSLWRHLDGCLGVVDVWVWGGSC